MHIQTTYHDSLPLFLVNNLHRAYSIEPRVAITGGGGTGAIIRAQVATGKITQFYIINPGSGYTTTPTLTITDPSETLLCPTEVRVGSGVLAQPTFSARGTDFETAGATISGDGYNDTFQSANFLNVEGLSDIPVEGSNFQLAGDDRYFKVVFVRELLGSAGNYNCNLQISPDTGIESAPAHGASITLRRRYSHHPRWHTDHVA